MIHSHHIRSEQPSGLVAVSSSTYSRQVVEDASLFMSTSPLRGAPQRTIGTLLSPIATPRNPTPSFRVTTNEAVASKIPAAVGIDASSSSKALGRSFLGDTSTETKAATSTFDRLLYASVMCESGLEATLASAAEVYVTTSTGSPHGSSPVIESLPTTDQNNSLRIRMSTVVGSSLKRKRLEDGSKMIEKLCAVGDANIRNCSGKHLPSVAVHLQKAISSERQESKLDMQSTTRCRCKRSRCLKKYCQCFLVEARCNEACVCTNCRNNDL
jgi:hypothetical protein